MKIIDPALIREFSGPGWCSWCYQFSPARDPHHIFSRGAGRLDVRINLASLCRRCHTSHHAGHEPTREQLLAIVARREGCLQVDIEVEIWRLRREVTRLL